MKIYKSKIYLLLFTGSILLMFSCQPQRNMDEIKSQITEMNNKMAKDMMAGDYLSSLEMYSEDLISLPSYAPMLRGKEAAKAKAEQDMNAPMKMTNFELETTDVMLAGEFVIEIGTYSLTMEMPMMPDGMEDTGKYMTVYEFQKDGSLKIKVDTWNS